MSRRTTAIGALVIAVLALVAVGAVAAVRPTTTTAGSAQLPSAPAMHPGADPLLKPVAEQPDPVWRADAHALFGPDVNPKYLMTVAADEKMAVVEAQTSDPNLNGAIMAVDPKSGKPLWQAHSTFQTHGCAISRDGRIGCIQYTDRSQKSAVLGIIDPANGHLLSTKPITSPGYADVQRAGDGFLVPTSAYSSDVSDKTITLNWYSSDGARSWTRTAATNLDDPRLSEAGNVIVLSKYDEGAQAFGLDSGQLLYDGVAELKQARGSDDSVSTTMQIIAEAEGFAVSLDDSSGKHDQVRMFDRLGIQRRVLDGWKLPFSPDATEGDVIPVHRAVDSRDYFAGAYSLSEKKIRWQQGGLEYDSGDKLRLVGSKYLMYDEHTLGGDGQTWTVLDATTGRKVGTLAGSIYMDYSGFDGSRIYFTGDMSAGEPGPGAISAYDPAHGETPVWRYKVSQSADDVNVRVVQPWMFRYDASVNGSVAAISRLG
jgi:hypothetical protein